MRIVFLSVNDAFAGEMQRYLYENNPVCVVGSVISSCAIYKRSTIGAVMFVIRKSGFFYLFQMIRIKIIKKLFKLGERETPSSLAKKHKVDLFYSKNINNKESLQRLYRLKPDIIISTNFSHFIGKGVRKIPSIGVWNLHKSYLPNYRGMAPNYYALLEGAENSGATLHVVDDGFDTGPIICQVRVPIQGYDTVYSLNLRTANAGGRMLAELLDSIDPNSIHPAPQPSGDWRTYSYPSRQDVRKFRKKKLRFV